MPVSQKRFLTNAILRGDEPAVMRQLIGASEATLRESLAFALEAIRNADHHNNAKEQFAALLILITENRSDKVAVLLNEDRHMLIQSEWHELLEAGAWADSTESVKCILEAYHAYEIDETGLHFLINLHHIAVLRNNTALIQDTANSWFQAFSFLQTDKTAAESLFKTLSDYAGSRVFYEKLAGLVKSESSNQISTHAWIGVIPQFVAFNQIEAVNHILERSNENQNLRVMALRSAVQTAIFEKNIAFLTKLFEIDFALLCLVSCDGLSAELLSNIPDEAFNKVRRNTVIHLVENAAILNVSVLVKRLLMSNWILTELVSKNALVSILKKAYHNGSWQGFSAILEHADKLKTADLFDMLSLLLQKNRKDDFNTIKKELEKRHDSNLDEKEEKTLVNFNNWIEGTYISLLRSLDVKGLNFFFWFFKENIKKEWKEALFLSIINNACFKYENELEARKWILTKSEAVRSDSVIETQPENDTALKATKPFYENSAIQDEYEPIFDLPETLPEKIKDTTYQEKLLRLLEALFSISEAENTLNRETLEVVYRGVFTKLPEAIQLAIKNYIQQNYPNILEEQSVVLEKSESVKFGQKVAAQMTAFRNRASAVGASAKAFFKRRQTAAGALQAEAGESASVPIEDDKLSIEETDQTERVPFFKGAIKAILFSSGPATSHIPDENTDSLEDEVNESSLLTKKGKSLLTLARPTIQ